MGVAFHRSWVCVGCCHGDEDYDILCCRGTVEVQTSLSGTGPHSASSDELVQYTILLRSGWSAGLRPSSGAGSESTPAAAATAGPLGQWVRVSLSLQGIQFLSSLSEVAIGLIAALIIAMVASWPLALVVVGFIPLLVGAGLVQVWLLGRRRGGTLSSSSSKVSSSSSSSVSALESVCDWLQVLLEGVIHIKTVQLFGLHDVFIVTYGSTLVVPLR